MEKYGVKERRPEDKTAEDKQTCPVCGRTLSDSDLTGGTLVCPVCGTEPFETK